MSNDKDLCQQLLLVSRAASFAAEKHSGQQRKGSAREPYINHLAEVAALIAETCATPDAALIAAAWLHDTIEDTNVDREDIADAFGEDVAALVADMTDDKSLPKAERKRLQIETAPHKSARARMLKIADKTSNVRSVTNSPPSEWQRERLIDYVDWAEQVVAGCRGVNPRLERLFDEAVARARQVL